MQAWPRWHRVLLGAAPGGGVQSYLMFMVLRTLLSCSKMSLFSTSGLAPPWKSGKEKAHKHKQIFPVIARAGGGLPIGWGRVTRPVARGQRFMCCVRNPRNINVFVRVPGREESGSRPGGSVTGVTDKLFMCQMFMCLFRPLEKGTLWSTSWSIPQKT